jgi:predicted peroxiredoxin
MAEVVIWQSSGYLNSFVTALFTALQLKGMGVDVAVVFDQAAVAALAQKKFDVAPPLSKYATTIMANVKNAGYSPDAMDYVKQCKAAGVPLYACEAWRDFLGVGAKLPPEIEVKGIPWDMKLLAEAKKVIGGP